MKKPSEQPPIVVTKAYDLVLWLMKKVESFPRSYRFTIGERLAAQSLDLLTLLTEAAYTRQKETLLQQASQKVNAVRLLLRMAKDLQILTVDSYAFSAGQLDEVGRMVGGWSKSAA